MRHPREPTEGLRRDRAPNALGLGLLLLCTGWLGCARLPEARVPKAPISTPAVVGGKGPLSARDASALLARRLGHDPQQAKALAALEEAATGQPLIAGNKVSLLFDGPATIAAMMAAVRAGQESIHLETYLFDQDPLGLAFADLLIAKQREGVQVRIIYDCVGTLGTPQAFFDRMQQAGIRLLPYHPVSPLHRLGRWRINNRDHRKILVVDGRVGFCGGVNITAAYSRSSMFKSRGPRRPSLGWRDTHLQIEGPAVAALQWMFLETWMGQGEDPLTGGTFFPELPPAGDKLVRVLGSSPGGDPEVYRAYLVAIQGATRSIHLTVAYFVPDRRVMKALADAARRGVEVKVILPSLSDSATVFHAGHSFYTEMLRAGIRVYELKASVLHAKTAVIDGRWSTVGSTNLDLRSFLHNQEVNAVVLGDGFGLEMEHAFQEDLQGSTEITAANWAKRSLGERLQDWLARRFAYWL